jgi:hypothetical protein
MELAVRWQLHCYMEYRKDLFARAKRFGINLDLLEHLVVRSVGRFSLSRRYECGPYRIDKTKSRCESGFLL